MTVDCTVNSCVWGIIRYSTEEGEGLMASLSYVPRDICFVFDDIDDSLFAVESLPTYLPTYLPTCLPAYLPTQSEETRGALKESSGRGGGLPTLILFKNRNRPFCFPSFRIQN